MDACERYRRQIRESRMVLVESIATFDHSARTAGEEVSRKPEMLLASRDRSERSGEDVAVTNGTSTGM